LAVEEPTLEDRLLPINTLVGLMLPNDVTPPALAEGGFQLVGLEVPAGGTGGSVTIDAVLLHAETSHLVVVESKSGANVEERQARAYAQLKALDVVQSAYVTLTKRAAPTIEVLYVCLREHVDRIRLGLEQLEMSAPIMSVSADSVRLERDGVVGEHLRDAFADGEVRLPGAVPRLIPFDQDSDVEVIQSRVLAALVSAMAQRLPQLTLTSLAERAMPQFALYGRQAQQRIKKKVTEAARRIQAAEPASFEVVSTTGIREGLVRILRTPEDNDPRGRTQAYQAVGRAIAIRKKRPKPEIPGQLDLLAALEARDNDSAEESTTETKEGER
jgi:hypothetical protein